MEISPYHDCRANHHFSLGSEKEQSMETPSTETMLLEYRRLLLEGNEEGIAKLKSELSALGVADQLQEADEWYLKCGKLVEEAKKMARSGSRPGDLAHNDLQKQAMELGDSAYKHVNSTFLAEYEAYNKEINDINRKKKQKNILLNDLQRYSSYDSSYQEKVDQIFLEIQSSYPEAVEEARERMALGQKIRDFNDKAYRMGCNRQKTEFQALLREAGKVKGIYEYLLKKMEESFNKGSMAVQRGRNMEQIVKKSQDLFQQHQPSDNARKALPENARAILPHGMGNTVHDVVLDHPNSLASLAPASSWTVMMDETGDDFTSEIQPGSHKPGKYVALLVPDYAELPDLPEKWHSVDMDADQVVASINVIRNAPCGIIGIPVQGLHDITADRWFGCVETILAMILRLLPLDGHTTLNIYIEQRDIYDKSANDFLDMTCKKTLYELSKVYPSRSAAISVKPQFISKDKHPWNGYVDSIAYLWGSNGIAQKQLLKMTGWLGTCLLDMDPVQLQNAIDAILTQNPLSPHEWDELLGLGDAAFTAALLHAIGQEAMNNPELWVSYLNFTKQHVNSKAVNLRALRRQIRWLKACQPPEVELMPRLYLLWLTTEIAEANHSGKLFKGALDEFMKVGDDLIEEDAPLVAWSRLHLAVSFTNEFDFESAQELLEGWAEVSKAIPGLQYHGQILSSLGQHQAFLGNPEDAIPFFDRAIECFERLSDEQEALLDVQQTTAYKLIAMMDAGMASTTEFNAVLEKYFDLPLLTATLTLASTDEQPYSHHVLLRSLATGNYPREVETYLKKKNQWKVGQGHPWELIQFYRGLIVENINERIDLFRSAYEIALAEGGATLDAIACVMLGSLYYHDRSVRQELDDLTEKVIKELPLIGEQRRQALRNQLENPIEPIALAQKVLPFNFR